MLDLLQQLGHERPHLRVDAFTKAQGEDMPPFTEVGFYDDAGCGRVGQHLAGVLWLAAKGGQVVISLFRILHTQPPVFGHLCPLQIEDRFNEGDIAIHADIALTLNTEACKTVPGQLGHHVTRSDLLYGHVGKFLRRQMPPANETADETGSAVRSNLAFGAVTVAASIFDLLECFCTISGFQNPDRLGNDLHGHNLLHCYRQQ